VITNRYATAAGRSMGQIAGRGLTGGAQALEDGDADDYPGGTDREGAEYEGALALETLVNMVDDAEEASYQARQKAEMCRRYYHGQQLTPEELAELDRRRQPPVIDNVIKRKIKFLKGHEKQTRTDPKAFARNEPTDEDAAETASDILRFQEQANRLDQKFSDVWEDILITGYGGIEVLGADPVDPRKIEVKVWRWDRLGHDPHSSAADFSDAKYLYGVIWLDEDEAIAKWPEAREAITKTMSDEISRSGGRTYNDKPAWNAWASRAKRPRVKIVQLYYRQPDGAWHWCILTRAGKIDGGAVELTDQYGRSVCPMLFQAAYVDQDNNRYGEVAEMLSLQDALNKQHSKALHLLSSRQTIAEQGAILDVDKFKREMARPDGHIEVTPGALLKKRFQVLDNARELAGHIELMRDNRAALAMVGPNATMEGKNKGVASGRAIRASQEGGLVELTDLRDLHVDLKRRTYEAVWNRCRQFLTDEATIRITDEDKKARYVKLNRPVTMLEEMGREAEKEGVEHEEIEARLGQAMQNPHVAQQLRQVVRIENAPAEMDMDIIIEVSTDTVNLQEETFQSLVDLANAGVIFPPEVYIEASPLRNKQKYLKALKPDPAQAGPAPPDPMQIKMQELQLQAQAKAADAEAQLQIEQQKADAAARAKEQELQLELTFKERELQIAQDEQDAEFQQAQRMRQLEFEAKQQELALLYEAKQRDRAFAAEDRARIQEERAGAPSEATGGQTPAGGGNSGPSGNDALAAILGALTAPKKLVRDAGGKALGVETVIS
jgi:hypothetical protein